jgi:hypothetical protein
LPKKQGGGLDRKVSYLWREPGAAKPYCTGVSLHSHTNYSNEKLCFIGDFINRHALLRHILSAEKWRAAQTASRSVDFSRAYWTPPLAPLAAFTLEKDQIERELGLEAMVSITDHDTIGAPMLLRVVPQARRVPVSVEWSVPYRNAIFHLGIHNLPSDLAEEIMRWLSEYTQDPSEARLSELLRFLHENRDVMVVLNHPLWDLASIGREQHERTLNALLREEGECFHAMELSGIRSWEENKAVRQLAEAWNQVTISGGDRHGCEPNATLNLTNAQSFTEFVHEIRRDRRSHVLFMPQYAEPNALRVLQTVLSVIRDYPDYAIGSRRWDERVFHPDRNGEIVQLSTLWKKPPPYVRHFFAALHLLEKAPVRNAMRVALGRTAEPSFSFDGSEEIAQ